MPIEGVLDDFIPPKQVRGWVRESGTESAEPIALELLLNGRVLGSARSGQLRPDVGGAYGFSIDADEVLSGDDLMRGVLRVTAISKDGSKVALPVYKKFQDELFRKGYSPFRYREGKPRFCIFTSAGDSNAIAKWSRLDQERDWDLIVAFYGESDQVFDEICKVATFANKQKGGKYQNLQKMLASSPLVFSGYDFIWVMDDDIILSPNDISKCFKIARWFNFSVCSPSFNPEGKISFDIMRQSRNSNQLRIVSFVETTCPIFRAAELFRVLQIYDGSLTSGFGFDYLYCHVLETAKYGRAAILDMVSVLNPQDHQKPGGKREVTKLIAQEDISKPWQAYQRRAHIPEPDIKVYASVTILSSDIFGSE